MHSRIAGGTCWPEKCCASQRLRSAQRYYFAMFGNLYEVYSVSAAHCLVFNKRTFVFQCLLLSPCFRLLFLFLVCRRISGITLRFRISSRRWPPSNSAKRLSKSAIPLLLCIILCLLCRFQVGDADNMHTEGEQKFCISHILKNIKARHLSLLSLPFRQHL